MLTAPAYACLRLCTSQGNTIRRLTIIWLASSTESDHANLCAPRSVTVQVDIEGAEWAVLDDYFVNGTAMPFAEILIELHVLDIPQRWGYDDLQRLRHFFRGLAAQGFRIANSELNMRCKRKLSRNCMHFIEYTLVKMDDSGNVLVS